jgi:hypothetical protein
MRKIWRRRPDKSARSIAGAVARASTLSRGAGPSIRSVLVDCRWLPRARVLMARAPHAKWVSTIAPQSMGAR